MTAGNAAGVAYPTLIDQLWDRKRSSQLARTLVLMVAGSALLTLSAKIQVPFYPVPMTMQSFMILVIGAAYGWRLGAATIGLYLLEGALGLPVFAGTPERGIGLAYMMGPTGGYLLGFLLGGALTGYLAERGYDRSVPGTLAAMFLGHVLLFVPGLLWLGALIGFDKVLAAGLYPFLWASLFKTALAAAVLPGCWFLLGRRG